MLCGVVGAVAVGAATDGDCITQQTQSMISHYLQSHLWRISRSGLFATS
jgi:hypothetical protein